MKTEWISVKDRLPEEGILLDVKLGSSRVIEKLKRHGELWFTFDDALYIWQRPTHWMPLSESPEIESL